MVSVIVVVVGGLLVFSLRSHDAAAPKVPAGAIVKGKAEVGRAAPTFTATDLAGKPVSLASYRGKPLILAFGASWCGPCRQEYPLLVTALAKHHGEIAIVSVMFNDLDMDAKPFLRELHANWPAVNDASGTISAGYGVNAVPQTFFITSAGVVQARVYGITSKGVLDGPLNRLLATG
jgi:cytochrome c biogenesis protein CcmG/thiol:disulfide interchange protein DsbE